MSDERWTSAVWECGCKGTARYGGQGGASSHRRRSEDDSPGVSSSVQMVGKYVGADVSSVSDSWSGEGVPRTFGKFRSGLAWCRARGSGDSTGFLRGRDAVNDEARVIIVCFMG